MVAIALAGAVASYVSDLLLNRAGERIVHDLRIAVYAHLQRLSLRFHDTRSKGDLVTRVTGDVTRSASSSPTPSERSPLGPAARGNGRGQLPARPVARARDVRGHAAACVRHLPLPPSDQGAGTATARRGGRDRVDRDRGALGDAGREGVRLGGDEYDRVERRSELRQRIGIDAARAGGALLGARRRARRRLRGARARLRRLPRRLGRADGGQPRRVRDLRSRTYKPLRELARQSAKVSRAAARADRIAELLATDDALRDRPGAYSGPRADGAVELDGVSFAYPGGRGLQDISLSLEPGEPRVALVGRSGAGKSTLAALVARFYDPASGVVRVDGRDARDCALAWLRGQVGILLQDTVLFRGTLADNIAYGADATREQILAAARAAGADEFVSTLPDGYDTELGPGGTGLSGGQRQRLGIARVLLRDPPILVLDEPTTGLDTASEAKVVGALERLMEGRTTIVVTHSIALARRAGRVVVLEGGRIVEDGTPDELLAAEGTFSTFATLSAGAPSRRGSATRNSRRSPSCSTGMRRLRSCARSAGLGLEEVRPRNVRYKPGRR